MNTDALISLPSKVHLLYGTKGTWLERIVVVFLTFNTRVQPPEMTVMMEIQTFSPKINQSDYDNEEHDHTQLTN